MMSSFDFDIGKFTDTYNLDLLLTYNALKVLQEEDMIELTESFFVPSTIHLLVDPGKLYEFQVAYGKLDPLVKVLLRMYGGELFVEYIRIQEGKLAAALNIPESLVIKQLEQMDNLSVLAYNPRKDQPQVTFLTPRYDAGKLPLNNKRISERRTNAVEKAEAMISYVNNSQLCRTNQFQAYFGEESDEQCGVCDVCVERKKRGLLPQQEDVLRANLIATLKNHRALTLEELTEKVGKKNDLMTVGFLRAMEDEGIVRTQDDGKIKLVEQ
jgi:ATP-dependent DNA helicase RecQ